MSDPAKLDLPLLRLAGRAVLPIVQGGMGVGVSAHRLAGAVAACNAMGTLSAVDLRRHYPNLMARTTHIGVGAEAKAAINAANLEALDRAIRSARALSQERGLLAVNVMRAVSEYAAYVRQACASGIDAVVVGGTPWLAAYLKVEARMQAKTAARGHAKPRCTMVFDCLAQCGLRDGIAKFGQFCIGHQLAAALRGDLKKGLFFRGAGRLPFGTQIRPVRDLIDYLLGHAVPAT
jgi:NAD(P)H-dependent flavin oxidoreductase YrpB (nitropropane dioxygenase family)